MKKIFLCVLCIFVFTVLFGTVCFATEPETTEEANTVITRIWEFVTEYKSEALSVAGDTGIIAMAAYIIARIARHKKSYDISFAEIKNIAGTSVKNQGDVVTAINKLIDSYNNLAEEHENLKAIYEKYQSEEVARSKAIEIITVETSALLEIMASVYVNSRLPQGTKDMVAVKYAKCLKAIESDETLSCVLKAAQNIMNAPET